MRLALLTWEKMPALHEDDAPLVEALVRRGIDPVAMVWERAHFDGIAGALIRSTWDYTWRHEEFLAWAERVPVPLWNPASLLRWNSHKRYLTELAARGAPVVPTEIVPAGARPSLDSQEEIVVKPCVSAGARDTHRLRPGDPRPALDPARDWMIQPYLPSVETEGEHSLLFFDGEFSHAIRKHPQLVEGKLEGGEPLVTPAPDELAAARKVLSLVEPLLYARVDLARGPDGAPLLMELEAFEPSLFLRAWPEAADRLAAAIARRLTSSSV